MSATQLQQGRFEFEPIDVSILPSGPIQGLLLAPWLPLAHELDESSPDNTLTDAWHEVFDHCISSQVRAGGDGVVERVLQAQDQVLGWYKFPVLWPRFVKTILDAREDSSAVQPLVDVGLQITRLPELLNAIRALRGPQLQYTIDVEPSSLVAVMTSHWQQRHHAGDEGCLELARSSIVRSLGVSL